MLIKKLLGKHKTEDYFFAVYWCGNAGIQSLLVKTKNGYWDVRNNNHVAAYQVKYKENLTDYVTFDKEYITEHTAKKSAKPYYDYFFKSSRNHDDEIFKNNYITERGMELQ